MSGSRPELPGTALAALIDHTLLRPDATAGDIRRLCDEAREHRFFAVCVNPVWVPLARDALSGTARVCAVVGFPLGASPPESKAFEARGAIAAGAGEIDMVLHIGALKERDEGALLGDIEAVTGACRAGGALCKVILETALLDDDEKRLGCRLACRAGAHFVKTSTGFGPGGATEADVALLAAEVRGAGLGVKASGGIRTADDVRRMVAAGATRIGTSSGVRILAEAAAPPEGRTTGRARPLAAGEREGRST
ncbi:MAG: deoxyribose-phosphate aldolase [Candidatus Eisenbacteria bacterium]|uniref:Deoxyribose-phosphate aldolase n=1 Tax=Eiseniibacteriota bacterium TaxID=2212470 RepID=A0A937X7P2_UNCEI|nr:deoxyribose-phosphate aldolase [Candidatus Eisenbacteria bacterium]